MLLTDALKPLLDLVTRLTDILDLVTLLTDILDLVTPLMDMEDLVMLLTDTHILAAVLLEDLAREVEEEVLDALTRPALSNSTTSAPTTSTTTSYSMPKSPYRASTATLEATVATDGAKRREGT